MEIEFDVFIYESINEDYEDICVILVLEIINGLFIEINNMYVFINVIIKFLFDKCYFRLSNYINKLISY